MKKLVVIALVLVILLAGCGPSDEECELAWMQLDVEPGDESLMVNRILNTNHAPDTVGAKLEECINGGWDGIFRFQRSIILFCRLPDCPLF